VAELPALPDGLTARPLRSEDVAAVAALLAAAEQIDDTGEYPNADDLAEWWTGWRADPARDGLAVCDGCGLVVGYAIAFAPPTFRDCFRVYLEGNVRPDQRKRGIGRALLGWLLGRGTAIHAERRPRAPGALVVNVPGTVPSLESLARRAGFGPERWYRYMERPLSDLPAVRPVPGVDLTPFTWDRDDEVRRAHNSAFTEHHGSSERDVASWQSLFTGQRAFRPDLSVLALEGDVVVGYVLAYVHEADTAATGVQETYLGQIGVLSHARGRGLASAMIGEALHAGARNDCRRAGLEVDSNNVTGAMRLYESLGFTATRTQVAWSRPLPPVG